MELQPCISDYSLLESEVPGELGVISDEWEFI
jgi:hypothetical protein